MTLPIPSLNLAELLATDSAVTTSRDHNHSRTGSSAMLAPVLGTLRGPVLGYFGPVDDTIDYELIHALAVSWPEWNIVIVNPTGVATDPESEALPRFANVHWLSSASYDSLPQYASAFHICLMPFAQQKSISRSLIDNLALHYISSGNPIISTCAPGEAYSGMIQVARAPYDFMDSCADALRRRKPTVKAAGTAASANAKAARRADVSLGKRSLAR